MRVSYPRPRHATIGAAVVLSLMLLLPTAALADSPRLSPCQDLLVTISPTVINGDAKAAAVTAQALVADVPGWESVTWSVADAVQLRDVLVLGADGATRSVGAQRRGTAADVLELGFCGAVGTAQDTEVAADPVVVVEPAPAPAPAPTAEPDPAPLEDAPAAATPDTRAAQAPAEDEASVADSDRRDDRDDDLGAALGGPIGPATAPYHDAALVRELLAAAKEAAHSVELAEALLLAASSTADSSAAAAAQSPASSAPRDGIETALVGLLTGAALAGALLIGRRRFGTEVTA